MRKIFGFSIISVQLVLISCFFSCSNKTNFSGTQSPQMIGEKLIDNLLARPNFLMMNYIDTTVNSIHYAEACAGFGAARLAGLLNDSIRIQKLCSRYSGVIDQNIFIYQNHVDANVYGILPLEFFMQNIYEQKLLAQGIELADKQWENPLPNGMTNQTRYWIDDMWMIGSLQIQAYRATGKLIYLERAALELDAYVQKLQQPNGLFFHGDVSHFFWGRGNGWVAASLAEIMTVLPKNNAHYTSLNNAYVKMMQALLKYQAEDGMWRQLVDHPEAWKETSCTAMFGYAITMGIKKSILPKEQYSQASQKAWSALSKYVNANGDVTDVCMGTGQKSDVNYYLTRPKATGDMHGQAAVLWFAYSMLLEE